MIRGNKARHLCGWDCHGGPLGEVAFDLRPGPRSHVRYLEAEHSRQKGELVQTSVPEVGRSLVGLRSMRKDEGG